MASVSCRITSTRRAWPLTFNVISRSAVPAGDDWPSTDPLPRNRYAVPEATAPPAITPLMKLRREIWSRMGRTVPQAAGSRQPAAGSLPAEAGSHKYLNFCDFRLVSGRNCQLPAAGRRLTLRQHRAPGAIGRAGAMTHELHRRARLVEDARQRRLQRRHVVIERSVSDRT